jgi:glycosyltransferase involved in cell wall biosynthesis
MKPLVSILIPAYNAVRYIGQTLKSAQQQTWPNVEIIVIDDGSSDETLEIAKRFTTQNTRVVGRPHKGASAARNYAYSLCQGDYIQWLDADDLLAPNKIAVQLSYTNRDGDDRMLFSSAWDRFYYRPRRTDRNASALWRDADPIDWLSTRFEHHLYMPPACWLMSRTLAESTGGWDERLSLDDDGEFFTRAVLKSDAIRFVPDAWSFYRINAGSLSTTFRSNEKLDSMWLSHQLQWKWLSRCEDSPRTRSAMRQYLEFFLICYFPERSDLVREIQQLAHQLGGEFDIPKLPPKYAWIEKLTNRSLAKRAMYTAPLLRRSVTAASDRIAAKLQQCFADF